MQKFLSILIMMLGMTIQSFAQESNDNSPSRNIPLEYRAIDNASKVHRMPMLMPVTVTYNMDSGYIDITNKECVSGEVYLYHNGVIIGYSSVITTSFSLTMSSGLYTVEIITNKWTAEGYLQF